MDWRGDRGEAGMPDISYFVRVKSQVQICDFNINALNYFVISPLLARIDFSFFLSTEHHGKQILSLFNDAVIPAFWYSFLCVIPSLECGLACRLVSNQENTTKVTSLL